MTPVATCPARARRRRESLSPTGELPTREDSLVALEELSTLESRVVCDASESGSLPSPMSTPEDPTMLRPRDKFHTRGPASNHTPSTRRLLDRELSLWNSRVDTTHRLIRADSLNNHRWQETEAKFLSAGSSDSLPPQDRWKTSLPPGQNTTAPRPRHI